MKTKKYIIERELLKSLYWGNRYTQIEIARIFGCSQEVISRNLKLYNIETDNRSLIQKGQHLSPNTEFSKGYKHTKDWKDLMSLIHKGKNHWNWKGGITKRPRGGRWSKAILEKNNYTFQICKKTNCELHAHHILPWSKYPELRMDLNNGITLCYKCHKNIHREGDIYFINRWV